MRRNETTGWTILLTFAGVLLLPPALSLAKPVQDKQDDKQEDQAEEGPRVVEDAEARTILKEEKKKLSSKEPRERAEAAMRIAKFSNDEFVSPLTKLLKDKDRTVVREALKALGSQPFKKTQSTLLKVLQNPKYNIDTKVTAEIVRALAKVGWSKSGYKVVRDYFDNAEPEIKREILLAFVAQKEIRSFSLFADNIDEPRPANPNSPSNPPASYWQKKWREWSAIKVTVRRGITDLTGQSFATKKAAVEWSKTKEARKLGYEYRSGS